MMKNIMRIRTFSVALIVIFASGSLFLNPLIFGKLLTIVSGNEVTDKFVIDGTIVFPLVNIILWLISLTSGFIVMVFILFPERMVMHINKNWKNYIVLGSVIIISLALIEISLHFIDLSRKKQNYYVDSYEFDYSVSLNSDYYRDDEFVQDELENKTKVFLIGDSFVFGAGVSQDKTIDGFIEEKSNYAFDVYNLGREETGLKGYYEIADEFKEYNPDIIILSFYVDNDVMEEGLNILQSSKLLSIISEVNFDNQCNFPWVRHYNISQEYIDLACNADINPWLIARARVGDNQEYYNERAQIFREQSLSKEMILKTRDLFPDSRFIILINPSKYQVDVSYFDQMEELGFVLGEELIDNEIQKELISFCEEENLEYIDVLPYLIASEESGEFYYAIDDHYNAKANEFVAELIVDYLI